MKNATAHWRISFDRTHDKDFKQVLRVLGCKVKTRRMDSSRREFVIEGPDNFDELVAFRKDFRFVEVEGKMSISVDEFFNVETK